MAEGKIVATLKAGRDFDAPWITIGADSPEELAVLVDRAGQAGLGAAVANAAKGLQATYTVAGSTGSVQQVAYETTPAASPTPPPTPTPSAQQAPPASGAPMCPHGQRTVYNGSKNGRAYTAYFCTLPKGHPDQCQPIWG
jgi:hypothetical protein